VVSFTIQIRALGFVGFHHDGVKEYKEEYPTVQPFHTLRLVLLGDGNITW
jgi:hypothetical protein